MKCFRKISLMLAAVFMMITASVSAQTPVGVSTPPKDTSAKKTFSNKLDEKGRKQGEWRRVDQFGKTLYVGSFKDDKPIGNFTYYDTSGRVMAIVTWRGVIGKTCFTSYYDLNGNVMGEGKYSAPEKKDSLWRYYKAGKLVMEETYVNGLLEGTVKKYFATTGKVAEERTYKAGKTEGKCSQYYEDGTKNVEYNYKAGGLEGAATWFHPGGLTAIKGLYKGDMKNGIWVFYDTNGKEKGRVEYVNGQEKNQKLITPQEMMENKKKYEQIENERQDSGDGGYPGG